MTRWATVKQVADHLQMTEWGVRGHISRGTELGKLFYKVAGETLRADLNEVDNVIKGWKE